MILSNLMFPFDDTYSIVEVVCEMMFLMHPHNIYLSEFIIKY